MSKIISRVLYDVFPIPGLIVVCMADGSERIFQVRSVSSIGNQESINGSFSGEESREVSLYMDYKYKQANGILMYKTCDTAPTEKTT